MSKEVIEIHGNAIPTPMKIPDWNQTDETKTDYIKNKPIVFESGFGIPFDETGTNLVTIKNVHLKEHDVEVEVASVNLLDDTDFVTSVTEQGITADYEGNGVFHIHGTSNGAATSNRFSFEKENEPNENYTLYVTLVEGVPNKAFNVFVGAYDGVNRRNGVWVPITPTSLVGTTYSKTAKLIINSAPATHLKDLWIYTTYSAGDTVDCRIQVWLEKGVAKSEPVYVPCRIDCESVNVLGKNLIPYPYSNMSATHNGVTFTVNEDGTITANGTATGTAYIVIYSVAAKPLPVGTYTMSGAPTADAYLQFSGPNVESSANTSRTFTIEEGQRQNVLTCCVRSGKTVNDVVFKPMIEAGTQATEFEKYKNPVTYPAEDGKAIVKSVSPTMNIKASESGVSIEAKGYLDGLAVIDELKQAIISLGGNV